MNKSLNINDQGKERETLPNIKVTTNNKYCPSLRRTQNLEIPPQEIEQKLPLCAFQMLTHQAERSLDAKGDCAPSAKLLYPEQNPEQDRILEQLNFRPCLNPPSHEGSRFNSTSHKGSGFNSQKGSGFNSLEGSGSQRNQSKPLNILLWEGSLGWPEHISLQNGGREVRSVIVVDIFNTLHIQVNLSSQN